MRYEKIDQPAHYQGSTRPAIEIIEDFDLNFSLGSAVKYILRAGKKPGETSREDLQKALWYVNRERSRPVSIIRYLAFRFRLKRSPSLCETLKEFDLSPNLEGALSSILIADWFLDKKKSLRFASQALETEIQRIGHT